MSGHRTALIAIVVLASAVALAKIKIGQFVRGSQWGIPLLPPATSSLEIFPHGALILDITSRAENEVVWRGVAQAELQWGESQARRDQRVREAVQELLKQFPPKAKKK